ncbi:glucose-6-phosphate isomerase 1, chloroplastic [Olea europaea subsp. europaea]|uniref:Glucose-6-phosphate isomerase 1, chloroplastic n=1 Tax=Olea europaea subsp. europaea TaxID=158383 RepID=A0A8S0QTT1_OLEEU|nr:glucose-6-phosphate isomerase 1, chloroplastic [Olea europaea subsp. europaea]
MATSISGPYSLRLNAEILTHKTLQTTSFRTRFQKFTRICPLRVAREVPPNTISSTNPITDVVPKSIKKPKLEKDHQELWKRYVDRLYQHKELGLYLDSNCQFVDQVISGKVARDPKATPNDW